MSSTKKASNIVLSTLVVILINCQSSYAQKRPKVSVEPNTIKSSHSAINITATPNPLGPDRSLLNRPVLQNRTVLNSASAFNHKRGNRSGLTLFRNHAYNPNFRQAFRRYHSREISYKKGLLRSFLIMRK
jgi:hypothetical protein